MWEDSPFGERSIFHPSHSNTKVLSIKYIGSKKINEYTYVYFNVLTKNLINTKAIIVVKELEIILDEVVASKTIDIPSSGSLKVELKFKEENLSKTILEGEFEFKASITCDGLSTESDEFRLEHMKNTEFTNIHYIDNKSIESKKKVIDSIGHTSKEIRKENKLTVEQIQSISILLIKKNIEKHIEGINETIEDNEINTSFRISNFLAQILYESGGLRLTKEGGVSESAYGGYPGRGLIQITGEENYKKYQDFSGEDVTSSFENRKKLENSPHAAKSAGWYWEISNLNPLADNNDFIMITRIINGGFNGYDDRLNYLKGALKSIYGENKEILDFTTSKAYYDKRATFAWGLWHDPSLNKKGCTKDKIKAIEGYQRFLEILPKDYKNYNWYGIKSISVFQSITETNSSVDVKKAAELRLKELVR